MKLQRSWKILLENFSIVLITLVSVLLGYRFNLIIVFVYLINELRHHKFSFSFYCYNGTYLSCLILTHWSTCRKRQCRSIQYPLAVNFASGEYRRLHGDSWCSSTSSVQPSTIEAWAASARGRLLGMVVPLLNIQITVSNITKCLCTRIYNL